MDEIDAALDFQNMSIIANYIKKRTRNTQFLIVSLRPYMYELCDTLVGIYKNFNCTKSVSIRPYYFEALVRRQPPTEQDAPAPVSGQHQGPSQPADAPEQDQTESDAEPEGAANDGDESELMDTD